MFVPALLRILQEGVYTTGKLFDVFCSGYSESYRKGRQLMLRDNTLHRHIKDWGGAYIEIQRFYNLLNYLKRQGLVEKKKGGGRQAQWSITRRGKKNLQSKKERLYEAEKDRTLRVVIFDVPETAKAKREWLRETLRHLGFSLLQDSVWIGARKIPDQFLFELKERELISCVHIFAVQKEGSIVNANR